MKNGYMSLCKRKPTIWVPTRSDATPAVQSQKMVYGYRLEILDLESKEIALYPCSKIKGADQLRSFCEADLRLCFRLCRLLVFPAAAHILLSKLKCTYKFTDLAA